MVAAPDSGGPQRRSVHFGDPAPQHGGDEKEEEDGMSRVDFLNTFSDHVARRDYRGALAICKERLRAKPDDRYVLQMRQTVQRYLDNSEDMEEDPGGEDTLQSLEELKERAYGASGRAFEAMFAYLQDEEKLWELGEQAVGIFWDVGLLAPWGPRRQRLQEMARALAEGLGQKLRKADRKSSDSLPALSTAADQGSSEWLSEALGLLWWRCELGLEKEEWLIEGCLEEWEGKSMEQLVGFSEEGLAKAELGDLTDVLVQVWAFERVSVCELLGERAVPSLEYGVGTVLAEIRRRPLAEPPLAGFYECFYLMTHVVYVLNCFNGHLPNHRTDCPWLFSYLERCLAFWLREVQQGASRLPGSLASSTWSAEAVDAVAEAVDCLLGLDEAGKEEQQVREALTWLLSRQEADGFFYSPNAERPAGNGYDHLHPTWTAAAALQLDRQTPGSSPRCAAWSRHAREAAREVGFSQRPPLPDLGVAPEEPDEEDEDED